MSLRNLAAICFSMAMAGPGIQAATLYSNIPAVLPPGETSLSLQTFGISEAGNQIQLAGTGNLNSATVVLSNYAYESLFEPLGKSNGYVDTVRLDLFNANPDGTVGTKITSATTTTFVPWQPEPKNSGCSDPIAYRAPNGTCYEGKVLSVPFSFNNVPLPNKVIFGVTYNTSTQGPNPFGTPGAYDSLNVGYTSTPPSVGSNPTPLISYLDLGKGFAPYDIAGLEGQAAQVALSTDTSTGFGTQTPEPSTTALFAVMICAGVLFRRRVAGQLVRVRERS